MIEERYYETLTQIHSILRPRSYIEIGVRKGESWSLVRPETPSIGVDPAPRIESTPNGQAKLFVGTSDDFFRQVNVAEHFGCPVELSFIDGMHLFEYALRDFANLERLSAKDGYIIIHDCLPIDEETSRRVASSDIWTGDVWKLVVCLKATRPDLKISTLDVTPSGLAVISNLNPHNDTWYRELPETIGQFIDLPFAMLGDAEEMRHHLNVVNTTDENVASIFSKRPVKRNEFGHVLGILRNKANLAHHRDGASV